MQKKSTPKRSLKKTKSTPKEKGAKAASPRKGELKRGVYIYSKLKDLHDKEDERVNLYASVLNSSAPYYHEGLKRYMCTMKLIDETLNPEDSKGKGNYLSTTFFANSKGNIPQPTRVGTIIRIHRGDTRKYGKVHQLNCDADMKAAWALFDPVEGFAPTLHTGHTYTFIDEDKKRVKDIRKFTEKFLKSYDIEESSTPSKKSNEVDLLCVMLNRKKKGKEERSTYFDGTKLIKIQSRGNASDKVAPGDVVYVRALRLDADHYILNEYSTFLKLSKEHKSAADILKKLDKAKKSKDFKDKLEGLSPEPGKAIVASEPLDASIKKVTGLKELFNLDSSKVKGKKFRVKVNALEIGPKDTASWIQHGEGKGKKP